MKNGESYRLRCQTLAVSPDSSTTVMMPEGAIVSILTAAEGPDKMIEVSWNGQALRLFLQDLEQRGEQTSSSGA